MQSSATVACRAIVMIACLIVIPLVALFGTSLPTMVASLVDRWQGSSPSANEAFGEAPLFQPGEAPLAGELGPPRIDLPGTAAAPGGLASAPPAMSAAGATAAARDPVVPAGGGMLHPTEAAGALPPGPMAAGYDAPLAQNPPYPNAPVAPPAVSPLPAPPSSSPMPTPTPPPADPYRPLASGVAQGPPAAGRELVPVAPPEQAPSGLTTITPAAGTPGSPAQPWSSPQEQDRFTQIHTRLTQLGADYYRLESWGTEQALFRFHCRVSLGAGPNLSRQFEATDRDPIGAMTRVLMDVETWRAGGPPVN